MSTVWLCSPSVFSAGSHLRSPWRGTVPGACTWCKQTVTLLEQLHLDFLAKNFACSNINVCIISVLTWALSIKLWTLNLVNCIHSAALKLRSISVYLLRDRTAWLYSQWKTYGRFWSQKQYPFDGNGLHCFARGDRWFQRERLRHLHAAAFSWNGQMRGQVL